MIQNRKTARYSPVGGNRRIFTCKETEVRVSGPAGTGKSRATLEYVYRCAMKYLGCRILFCRKTRASLTDTTLVTFESHVLPEGHYLLYGPSRRTRHSYIFKNGSEIVCGGLDRPERVMSSEYDIICVDEATEIDESAWEILLSRLRNHVIPYQQGIAICNPNAPKHWLNVRKMYHIDTFFADNPTLTKEYLQTLSNLSGHRRKRLYEGIWSSAEGSVYTNADTCIVDPFEIIPKGRKVGGIDFGFRDPFVALSGVLYFNRGKNMIYIYDETYKNEQSLQQMIFSLKKDTEYFADPSRPDTIDELNKAGIKCHGANNDVLNGILMVTNRFNTNSLLISKKCERLLNDLSSYAYDPDKEGPQAEKPMHEYSHGPDALRYLVATIDGNCRMSDILGKGSARVISVAR
jgi:phage terminase large subunit